MRAVLRPWRHPSRILAALAHLAIGLPMSIVAFTVVLTMMAVSVGLIPVFLIGVPLLALTLAVAHLIGAVERHRAGAYLGRRIADPVPPLRKPGLLARLGELLRCGPRWAEVGYSLALLVPAAIGFAVSTAVWSGSLAMLALPAYVHHLPGESAKFYFFEISQGPAAAGAAVVGLLGLAFAAPWTSIGLAEVQAALARKLLGPSRDAELHARVERAESTRSAAVDAAEAERRRIERDLHDGAQQRLVALAADLGAARERMTVDPQGGQQLVAQAHEEAKAALREIRDLVRGIHPVILEDRGLDAALSAVVARSPVPVRLTVDVHTRPPAAVESAAYFVVSEALTNVARHARATKAGVAIARAGDRLVIEVRDDGIGGADADVGTGLQGLRDRVGALKGSMYVISPPGGPTTISVELPCGS
jgi:signal transduction histidine kinase